MQGRGIRPRASASAASTEEKAAASVAPPSDDVFSRPKSAPKFPNIGLSGPQLSESMEAPSRSEAKSSRSRRRESSRDDMPQSKPNHEDIQEHNEHIQPQSRKPEKNTPADSSTQQSALSNAQLQNKLNQMIAEDMSPYVYDHFDDRKTELGRRSREERIKIDKADVAKRQYKDSAEVSPPGVDIPVVLMHGGMLLESDDEEEIELSGSGVPGATSSLRKECFVAVDESVGFHDRNSAEESDKNTYKSEHILNEYGQIQDDFVDLQWEHFIPPVRAPLGVEQNSESTKFTHSNGRGTNAKLEEAVGVTISLPSSGLFCEDDDDIEEPFEDPPNNNVSMFHKTLPKTSTNLATSDIQSASSRKLNISSLKLSSFDADKS
jgi:hypothetical protein